MTSPVTPDEPAEARSEDREAAPRTEAGRYHYEDLCAWFATKPPEVYARIVRAIEDEARGAAASAVAAAAPDNLSTTWEAAEAALPEGWRLKGLELGSDWRAYAEPSPAYTRHGRREMWLGIGAHGPTKEAALAALTARLQARSTEPKP